MISGEKIRNLGNYKYDYAHFTGSSEIIFNPSRYTGLNIYYDLYMYFMYVEIVIKQRH